MAKLLRAAVIGAGNTRCNHARVYVEMDDVLFAAAADPDQDALCQMANTLERVNNNCASIASGAGRPARSPPQANRRRTKSGCRWACSLSHRTATPPAWSRA